MECIKDGSVLSGNAFLNIEKNCSWGKVEVRKYCFLLILKKQTFKLIYFQFSFWLVPMWYSSHAVVKKIEIQSLQLLSKNLLYALKKYVPNYVGYCIAQLKANWNIVWGPVSCWMLAEIWALIKETTVELLSITSYINNKSVF